MEISREIKESVDGTAELLGELSRRGPTENAAAVQVALRLAAWVCCQSTQIDSTSKAALTGLLLEYVDECEKTMSPSGPSNRK